MIYMHPVFMLILIGAIYYTHRLGKNILTINPKSPEGETIDELIKQHGKIARIITALIFVGMLGGLFAIVNFMGVEAVFIKSYGHGVAGVMVFMLLFANIFVGGARKRQTKEKLRAGLLRFHKGLYYCAMIVACFSLITGLVILFKGPAA